MIDPISAAHVVSSFKRTQYVGSDIQVSHIKHVETGGAKAVEEIMYTTYNAQGKESEAKYLIGATVDIII